MAFWNSFLLVVTHNIQVIAGGIGLGGLGVGFIKLMKHIPAPYQDQPWAGAMFDTVQDLVTNNRIGERRTREGVVVSPVPAPKEVPQPVAASTVAIPKEKTP